MLLRLKRYVHLLYHCLSKNCLHCPPSARSLTVGDWRSPALSLPAPAPQTPAVVVAVVAAVVVVGGGVVVGGVVVVVVVVVGGGVVVVVVVVWCRC